MNYYNYKATQTLHKFYLVSWALLFWMCCCCCCPRCSLRWSNGIQRQACSPSVESGEFRHLLISVRAYIQPRIDIKYRERRVLCVARSEVIRPPTNENNYYQIKPSTRSSYTENGLVGCGRRDGNDSALTSITTSKSGQCYTMNAVWPLELWCVALV